MAEETVLLNFEIDQGKAEKDLIALNKAMLNNKEAQADLNKAYKAGTITQDEYVKENIRLQQNLKKEQQQVGTLTKLINTESNSRNALKAKVSILANEYDNLNTKTATGAKRADELQKELTQLNAQITKSSKSAGLFKDQIGNYPDQFKNAAAGINVAGVSLGDLGNKFSSFLTPATAAVGIAGALGAAYAKSTRGAKDLEFAQSLLSTAIKLTSNSFANLITTAEDGEGILAKVSTAAIVAFFGKNAATQATAYAKKVEEIQDLEREEINIRSRANDVLDDNQDKLTEIAKEETTYQQKLKLTKEIIDGLNKSQAELVRIKEQELLAAQYIFQLDQDDEQAETNKNQRAKELSDVKKEYSKRLKGIQVIQDNIVEAETKQVLLAKQQADTIRDINDRSSNVVDVNSSKQIEKNLQIEADIKEKFAVDNAKLEEQIKVDSEIKLTEFTRKYETERTEIKKKELEIRRAADQSALQSVANSLGSVAQLFKQGGEEYKIIASAETLISTYVGATKAYESQASIPYVGPELGALAAAEAIIAGLANLAVINGVQFAEGGYTGSGGKYQPAGIVHKGEYVAPQHVMNNPAAQPHISALESMRLKGYADGGFVTNQSTAQANNALMIANAMKNQPPIYASWVEGRAVGRKLDFKEQTATL